MKIPRKGTWGEKIALSLYHNGPQNKKDLYDDVYTFEGKKESISNACQDLIMMNSIYQIDDMLYLSDGLHKYYSDTMQTPKKYKGEIVPNRTYEFKPLSKKHMPSVTGTRDEALSWRDIKSRFI